MKSTQLLKELNSTDSALLLERVSRLRAKLYELRTQGTTEKIADTAALGRIRREIARALTIVNQRKKASAG